MIVAATSNFYLVSPMVAIYAHQIRFFMAMVTFDLNWLWKKHDPDFNNLRVKNTIFS